MSRKTVSSVEKENYEQFNYDTLIRMKCDD